MTGKEKCQLLRDIRKKIAENNNIEFPQAQCDYVGDDCSGTCPICDMELNYLEHELTKKIHSSVPCYLAESLPFRSKDNASCEETDSDALVFDVVLPKCADDPDPDLLALKLNRAGIATTADLLQYSPEELADFGLTEQELDDLSLRLRFRGENWIRRRRKSLQDSGTRGIMRSPYRRSLYGIF